MKKILLSSVLIALVTTMTHAQWEQTNGPTCNPTVWALAVSGSYLYAGSGGDGIFKSNDGGANWTAINNGIPLTQINVSSIYASGSLLLAGVNNSLYRSMDNGANWFLSNAGLPGTEILAINANLSYIFVGTYGSGIYRSHDNGLSWVNDNYGVDPNAWVTSFAFAGTKIFAGTTSGLFVSTNNGDSWSSTTVLSSVLSVAVHDQFVIAGTEYSGFFRSVDGGNTWVQLGPYNGYNIGSITIDWPYIYASKSMSILVSTNNGDTWTSESFGIPSNSIPGGLIVQNSRIFCCASDVLRSDNHGVKWEPANNGIPFNKITALSVQWINIYAATNGGGVYISNDNGGAWIYYTNNLLNRNVNTFFKAGDELLAGTDSGVYVSPVNWYGWTEFNNGLINRSVHAFASDGSKIYTGTDDGVYLSTDDGYTWVSKTIGLTNKHIRTILVSGNSVFTGTNGGGVFRSDDTGNNWVSASYGLGSVNVNSMAEAGDAVFAGADNGVYRTRDNGLNWTTVNNGLGSTKINVLLSFNTSLFAGTDKGIYLTADFGDNWAQVNDGLPDTVITSLGASHSDLFAGVLSKSVWTRPLSEMFSLQITPQNLVLEPLTAVRDTLFIVANTVWTIKGTLPDWLGESKYSGTGNDYVVFTSLQSNSSNQPRFAMFTVETTSGNEMAFSVMQKSGIMAIYTPSSNSVVVSPNPTSGYFNISSERPVELISVYTPAGDLLFETRPNRLKTGIDLSIFGKGVYYLKIYGKSWTDFRKIVVY